MMKSSQSLQDFQEKEVAFNLNNKFEAFSTFCKDFKTIVIIICSLAKNFKYFKTFGTLHAFLFCKLYVNIIIIRN